MDKPIAHDNAPTNSPSHFSAAAVQTAIATVSQNIIDTAKLYQRKPEDITLVAVSKTFKADHIRPALESGMRVFGENRVQEAHQKWPSLRHDFSDIKLHLIGPLQSNKVKQAFKVFDVIETVDRRKLAEHIARERDLQQGKCPTLFLQVNSGEETQKAGISPTEVDEFIPYCRDQLGLPVAGLMCIPPIDAEAALHFAYLRTLAARHNLSQLSMGMSADYDIAIQFGATHIRLGTAIFGPRTQKI